MSLGISQLRITDVDLSELDQSIGKLETNYPVSPIVKQQTALKLASKLDDFGRNEPESKKVRELQSRLGAIRLRAQKEIAESMKRYKESTAELENFKKRIDSLKTEKDPEKISVETRELNALLDQLGWYYPERREDWILLDDRVKILTPKGALPR